MRRKTDVVSKEYVGIPLAALLADAPEFNVVGIQRRSERSGWKTNWLNAGKNPTRGDEPELCELVARVLRKGTSKVAGAMSTCKDAEAVLIDVQTPNDATAKAGLTYRGIGNGTRKAK